MSVSPHDPFMQASQQRSDMLGVASKTFSVLAFGLGALLVAQPLTRYTVASNNCPEWVVMGAVLVAALSTIAGALCVFERQREDNARCARKPLQTITPEIS